MSNTELDTLFLAVGTLKKYQCITKYKALDTNLQRDHFRKSLNQVFDGLIVCNADLDALVRQYRNHIVAMRGSKLERNGLKIIVEAVEKLIYEK